MKLETKFLSAIASFAIVSNIWAGSITGTIQASAPKLEAGDGKDGAYQSRRFKFLDKIDYENLRDFVVSIDEIKQHADATSRPLASVAQKDGDFVPKVIPVVAGSEIEWPNRDDIFHNVFSMSEARPFDLGMYKSTDSAKSLVFEKEGQIDVFCAIHSQMHCVVLVMPNPWFDKSDRKGKFKIENVPPGNYRLKAWHERLPAKYIDITVPEEGDVEIDIQMGFADLPKI